MEEPLFVTIPLTTSASVSYGDEVPTKPLMAAQIHCEVIEWSVGVRELWHMAVPKDCPSYLFHYVCVQAAKTLKARIGSRVIEGSTVYDLWVQGVFS